MHILNVRGGFARVGTRCMATFGHWAFVHVTIVIACAHAHSTISANEAFIGMTCISMHVTSIHGQTREGLGSACTPSLEKTSPA